MFFRGHFFVLRSVSVVAWLVCLPCFAWSVFLFFCCLDGFFSIQDGCLGDVRAYYGFEGVGYIHCVEGVLGARAYREVGAGDFCAKDVGVRYVFY